ncbi:odorant receptor 26 [Nasonia vitripennis]|uniref:Odorant receptor n=1 Tax=Nasonia vitripennis TaxID=7425 RepID=A0A7M6UWL7_NASVI|nr:odorant receptor 26 [Nasonia vitripennis]
MDKKRGFDHTFGMCSINLGIVGLWPNSKNTKFQEFRSNVSFVFAIFSVSVFISMSQTAKLIMIWGDLYQMIENISTANLPITVTVFKMLIFRSHKKVLGELLALAIGDWCTKKTEEETANMCANARLAHRISMICVFLAGGTVSIHAVLRTCQELDIMPGPPEKRLPLFSSSYVPYDYKSSPIYQVTWLMQLTGTSCATLVFSGVYCAFVGMVLHLRGQVANLRLKLENICEIREKGEGLVEARRDFRKKLGFIVERHLVLNRFAADLETVFTLMFLAELLSCTIQICLQVFLLVTLLSNIKHGFPILELFFLMVYIMHVGTHVFICCFVADKLREESLLICNSVYNYQWYKLSAQDAKMLIFVMHRGDRPLAMTAGKFCAFSLQLYAQILKTSGGYLSMLLALKDQS